MYYERATFVRAKAVFVRAKAAERACARLTCGDIIQKVLRDEKVRAENQISAADKIVEPLLETMADAPSSEMADRQKVDSLLEGACKLMALCEVANDEDAKRYTRKCTYVVCRCAHPRARVLCIRTWLKCLLMQVLALC